MPCPRAPADEEVYVLSRRGEDELQRGATSLSATELEFLVRVDGHKSLAAIHAGMRGCPEEPFGALVGRLLDRGLVVAARPDPVGSRLQEDLARWSVFEGGRDPDAPVRTLASTGFYVGIARPRQGTRPAAGAERPLTAIVVEDEPVLARFIKSYLAFEGIRTRLAATRDEVVAEFAKLPVPDVVLLDVKLPDADGFEILQKLRAHPVFKTVPVIMLTGSATRESVIRGLAAGADGYMTKPFEAESLIRAVRTVLGLPGHDQSQPGQADPWANWDSKTPRRAVSGLGRG